MAPKPETQKFSTDALELEIHLTEKLKSLGKQTKSSTVMTSDKFAIYQKIFADVIDRDKNYGSLLMKIKKVYDDSLQNVQDKSVPDIEQIINDIKATKA
jgi:hypothetical protein